MRKTFRGWSEEWRDPKVRLKVRLFSGGFFLVSGLWWLLGAGGNGIIGVAWLLFAAGNIGYGILDYRRARPAQTRVADVFE